MVQSASPPNLFVIVIDGLRWQEVFNGADTVLINDSEFTPDRSVQRLFSADTKEARRKMLLPFFWKVVAKSGLVYGDRDTGSKVDVLNPHLISYAGFSEMFTGKAGLFPIGNKKRYNDDKNVLELLHEKPAFKKKIAVFASWNGIPYVLNKKRNGIMMDCGFEESTADKVMLANELLSGKDKKGGEPSPETRRDAITFEKAKKYIFKKHPRVVVIAFGEGDVQAHQKRYDLYLKEAHTTDRRIAELWKMLQEHPVYKNNTNLMITTDHGRGNNNNNWHDHGMLVKGSSETWLGLLGPAIRSLQIDEQQLYNKDIAAFIANLVGEEITL